MSKLKEAFEVARDKNNIGLILPEFLSATFYIVGVDTETNGKQFDFAQTKSPNNKEMCITISEDRDLVSFKKWSNVSSRGRELLKAVPKNCGILIAYKSGGDYITRKQVDWFLEVLD